jgi:hypothetical protein
MAVQYFAAVDTARIGKSLAGRLKDVAAASSSTLGSAIKSWEDYYSTDYGQGTSIEVRRGGEQGEYAQIRVPRHRSYLRALLALILAPKLAWRPEASTGDAGSAKATSVASAICESEWKLNGLSTSAYELAEAAFVMGHSFICPFWDETKGPAIALRNDDEAGGESIERDGAMAYRVRMPWDVMSEPRLTHPKDAQWYFVRSWENKFDLAAMHPATVEGKSSRELILSGRKSESDELSFAAYGRANPDAKAASDLIPVWDFFHAPSPTLPAGLRVKFVSSSCVLVYGTLQGREESSAGRNVYRGYPGLPVFRLSADEMLGTAQSWSAFWDTLGAQEVSDDIDSSVASIMQTLGNSLVWMEEGNRREVVEKGLRILWGKPGSRPPMGLNLAVLPPDALNYRAGIAADQRQILGLNDVALGQPQGAQMNAQAFAVLMSAAVQQAGPFQSKLFERISEVGTFAVQTIRMRASQERQVDYVGQASRHLVDGRYTPRDLDPIRAVRVQIGNPLEQTPSGRMATLQMMAAVPGVIRTAEEIQQVIETGRIDPATRALRDENHLVREEYEELQQGKVPTVLSGDNHILHYQENYAVLKTSNARADEGIVAAVEEHCALHYEAYFGVPPFKEDGMGGVMEDPLRRERERFLLGFGPEPMMAPPAAPGEPPPGAGGEPGVETPGDVLAAPNPAEALAAVEPPQPPTNPATGAPIGAGVAGIA